MVSVEGKLSLIKEFEEGGLISCPEEKEIDLEKIIADANSHLNKLKEAFGEVRQEFLNSISDFTTDVYLSFFDTKFLKTKSTNSKKYDPKLFLDAVNRLSLEMSNSEKLERFYELLKSNFKHSSRFVYRFFVKNLSSTFDELQKGKSYSKKEFSEFTLEVLSMAEDYSAAKVTDKWSIFKEVFYNAKEKYFPENRSLEKKGGKNNVALDYEYISNLSKGNPKEGIMDLQEKFGLVLCVDYHAKREGNNAKIPLIFEGDRRELLYVDDMSSYGRDFLLMIADTALKNLREKGYSGPYIGITNKAKHNISKYL